MVHARTRWLVRCGSYSRHAQVFRREARPAQPRAALPLVTVVPATTCRRALLVGMRDTPRFPQNPRATGMAVPFRYPPITLEVRLASGPPPRMFCAIAGA